MKSSSEKNLYSVIMYLSPGDYHRFHFPSDLKI